MPFKLRLSPLPILACALLGLSGCVAVPLAQMAASQMSPANPTCPGCSLPAPGVFDNLSTSVSGSFQKFAGSLSGNQTAEAQSPAK